MQRILLFTIIAIMLSACSPASTPVPQMTDLPIPTQTATLVATQTALPPQNNSPWGE